jgi:hypothetical protein
MERTPAGVDAWWSKSLRKRRPCKEIPPLGPSHPSKVPRDIAAAMCMRGIRYHATGGSTFGDLDTGGKSADGWAFSAVCLSGSARSSIPLVEWTASAFPWKIRQIQRLRN